MEYFLNFISFYLQSHDNNDNYLQQQNTNREKKESKKQKKISADLQDLRYKINYNLQYNRESPIYTTLSTLVFLQ